MRRLGLVAAVLALALTHGARAAKAQSRWSLEVSGGAAFPTRTIDGADLNNGGGFGANLRLHVQPHLAAYGGWEWHMRQTTQLVPAQTLDLNDNGYTFGLRFDHPLIASVTGWLRAGGLYNHIEIENADGKTIHDSGHGLGWETGAGLGLPLAERVDVLPGVRYRMLSRDIVVAGKTRSATLSYVNPVVGLVIKF